MKTKMKPFPRRGGAAGTAWVAMAMLAGFTGSAGADVTFTVTPSAVSNTCTGTITLQIGGRPTGDAIVVRKFLDANTNSAVNGVGRHPDMFSRENFNNAIFNGE